MEYFISGDWPFFYKEQISNLSWWPEVYRVSWWFGENMVPRLWIEYPFRLIVKLSGFPWLITEKILLLLIIFLAFWSAYQLSGKFFKESWLRFISGIVYVGNTYFFLVLGGGQLGVAAAYAFFPFVLLRFIHLFDIPSIRNALAAGIFFAVLTAMDLRIAYVSLIAFFLFNVKKLFYSFKYFFVTFIVALSLHLYWILPAVLFGVPTPESATGAGSLSFFSVADFSHALSLLHPNWPENLFGRVYFQQPEFLILPILAFASLLFEKRRFFVLLTLIGVFLAKGVNEPFGFIYNWLFANVPGFNMFRDPTKFYTLIALSYSILIPVTLKNIIKNKKIVVGLFLLVQLFLFRDVFIGKTMHSFQFRQTPQEYTVLKNILQSDRRFSRVLWLPAVPHFAYSDDLHPFVDATHIPNPYTRETLAEHSIGYIVVPTDEAKNMFLTDYTEDPSIRQTLIHSLEDDGYPRMGGFADLAVFRNLRASDLFETGNGSSVSWKQVAADSYTVAKPPETLVMHVSFDPGWNVNANGTIISGQETNDGWIQFALPAGVEEARVYFAPDAVAKTGAIISGILLILFIFLCLR